MGRYRFLCVRLDFNGVVWVFVVLMHPHWSLCLFLDPDASLWILMGLIVFLSVFMCPSGS